MLTVVNQSYVNAIIGQFQSCFELFIKFSTCANLILINVKICLAVRLMYFMAEYSLTRGSDNGKLSLPPSINLVCGCRIKRCEFNGRMFEDEFIATKFMSHEFASRRL